MSNVSEGWEATEAAVTEWLPAEGIDWARDLGPVRPPLAVLSKPGGHH